MTPISIAPEFFTGSRLVTRKIAVRICGPITMIRASGSIWRCSVKVEAMRGRALASYSASCAAAGGAALRFAR